MGLKAGLDGCGKSRLHRDSIPGLSSSTFSLTSALDCGWLVNATPWPLYHPERLATYSIGGWVGPRTGLNGCGKPRLYRDSIPGLSRPQRAAIQTELSRTIMSCNIQKSCALPIRRVPSDCQNTGCFVNHLKTKRRLLYLKIQSVPRCKHFSSRL